MSANYSDSVTTDYTRVQPGGRVCMRLLDDSIMIQSETIRALVKAAQNPHTDREELYRTIIITNNKLHESINILKDVQMIFKKE